MRGIVINRKGYVTRACTRSPSDGVRSRTVTAIRSLVSRTFTTRRAYPVLERGPTVTRIASRCGKSIGGTAGARPGVLCSRNSASSFRVRNS